MGARVGLVVVLGALALSGCSGGDGNTTTAAAEPTTTVKIVSDLPLQGYLGAQSNSMVVAIELYLDQVDHRAGPFEVTYESFDNSINAGGHDWPCNDNPLRYVQDEQIVGVIGPFSSDCARAEIPIANAAALAMISPATTDVGLTHQGPGSAEGEPDSLYPTGVRTYARLVPPDDVQAGAGVKTLAGLGVTKVCVLDDREAYGRAIADAFVLGANEEGLEVVCRYGWRHGSEDVDYLGLMEKVKASGADSVYIAGISDGGGAQLIQDKLAVVGDNEAVKLLVSDGFVVNELFEEAGSASLEGVYGTTPALSPQDLTGAGAAFVAAYAAEHDLPKTYTAYGAAAAQVLVDAIGRSDGTRADIAAKLFETDIPDGIVGPVRFDPNGDRVDAPVAVFQARHGAWEFLEASP